MIPASIRNHNPGAMYPGASSKKFGSRSYEVLRSKDGTHKIATFPTAIHGAAAQFDLLHRSYTNMTIEKAIAKWCGGFYASTYIKVLESKGGVKRSTVLTKAMVKNPEIAIPLAKAMALQEAGKAFPLTDEEWAAAHQMAFQEAVAPSYTADNDVPTPKAETRASETVKPVTRPVVGTAVVDTGWDIAHIIAPDAVPSPPLGAISRFTEWQTAGASTSSLLSSPNLLWIVGAMVAWTGLMYFLPKIAERFGWQRS